MQVTLGADGVAQPGVGESFAAGVDDVKRVGAGDVALPRSVAALTPDRQAGENRLLVTILVMGRRVRPVGMAKQTIARDGPLRDLLVFKSGRQVPGLLLGYQLIEV
jgi:hypothetical protein